MPTLIRQETLPMFRLVFFRVKVKSAISIAMHVTGYDRRGKGSTQTSSTHTHNTARANCPSSFIYPSSDPTSPPPPPLPLAMYIHHLSTDYSWVSKLITGSIIICSLRSLWPEITEGSSKPMIYRTSIRPVNAHTGVQY